MKRTITLLLGSAITLLACVAPSQAADDLLGNPGFEEALGDSWTTRFNGSFNGPIPFGTAPEGSQVLVLDGTSANGIEGVEQHVAFAGQAGDVVTFSFATGSRGTGGSGNIGGRIFLRDATETTVDSCLVVAPKTDPMREELTCTLTPEADYATILVQVGGQRVTRGFYGFDDVQLSIQEEVDFSITETEGSTTVAEGGASDTLTVALDVAPATDETVTLTFSDALEQVTIVPMTVSFTVDTWDVPQEIEIAAVDDTDVEGIHTADVAVEATSTTGSGFEGQRTTFEVLIADNDGGSAPEDTETFIDETFDIQTEYMGVRCVSEGDSCPAEITTAPPCLTEACTLELQTYDITATYTTIQAASDAAVPGDLIIIMPGTYNGVNVEETGGENGGYIHFLGWGDPGSVVVNEVSDPSQGWQRNHFYFINAHHYIIENIAFTNAEIAGIFISGFFNATGSFSTHFVVKDVYSHDNGKWGMHTTAASHILIQDSVFTNSGDEHGVYISGSGDDMVIRRNVFQGNSASGLQVNADPQVATTELWGWLNNLTGNTCGISESEAAEDGTAEWHDVKACYDSQSLPDLGQYIEDGISERLIIEQNVSTGNGAIGAAGINLASVRNSTVRNNLIYGNSAAAIACWDNNYVETKNLASSVFGCQNVTVVNNTMVDETASRAGLVFNHDALNMTAHNNIIVRPRSDAYEIVDRSAQGLNSGHNYYFSQEVVNSSGWVLIDSDPASGSITGFTLVDALAEFVDATFNPWVLEAGDWPTLNPNRPDYHPVEGSVLLTGGSADFIPALDFSGEPFTGTEIGAFGAAD